MYRIGIIEESLENTQKNLEMLKPYFYLQKIENVPDDEYPVWHTNEYHVEEKDIINVLSSLKNQVKFTWYIHAFSNDKLFVVLRGKIFEISPHKDNSWDEMIKYGVEVAQVEKHFLENVPLHV